MLFFPAGARPPPGLLPPAAGMALGQRQPPSTPSSPSATQGHHSGGRAGATAICPTTSTKGRGILLFPPFHQGLGRGEAQLSSDFFLISFSLREQEFLIRHVCALVGGLLSTQSHEERDGCPSQGMQLIPFPCQPHAKARCDGGQQLDLLCCLNEYAHDLQITADSAAYYR